MKKLIMLFWLAITGVAHSGAQTASDVTKEINRIKRDTMYVYAETTMKDLDEAYNGARAILEMKVGDWVRSQYPNENIEVCIVKAKEHFVQLETRRGDLFRAFVYVRKNDIMPVSDKSEVTVFEVDRAANPTESVASQAIIIEETPVSQPPALELTPDETQMRQIGKFYDVEPYIKDLKNKGKLKNYGKYATMPEHEDCHLFVYNKQGDIVALLRKNGPTQYNLGTLKEDDVKNYKNCGAIWFQLKD